MALIVIQNNELCYCADMDKLLVLSVYNIQVRGMQFMPCDVTRHLALSKSAQQILVCIAILHFHI